MKKGTQSPTDLRDKVQRLEIEKRLLKAEIRGLTEENKKLREASNHDPLTKVLNRRGLNGVAEPLLASLERQKGVASVLMLDLDHFKKVNDTYEHRGGDVVLVEFAKLLKDMSRKADIVARLGGEEFALLLPNTDVTAAETVANTILEAVRRLSFHEYPELKITTSIGVSDISCSSIFLENRLRGLTRPFTKQKRPATVLWFTTQA